MFVIHKQEPQIDFHLVGLPLDTIKFEAASPVLIGPISVNVPVFIASLPQQARSGGTQIDVLSSFEPLSPGVAAIYLSWMFVAWALSVLIRKSLNRGRNISSDHFMWDIMRTFCNQDSFESDLRSLPVLGTVVVMSAFWLIQYYNGFFGTDLTLPEKEKTIDSLEDLLAEGLAPAFWKGDPTFDHDFLDNNNPINKKVYELFLRHPKLVPMTSQSVLDFFSDLETRRNALISSTSGTTPMSLLRCVNVVTQKDSQTPLKPFHLSRQIAEVTRAYPYHVNVSKELRERLDWGLGALFESHVAPQVLDDDLGHEVADRMGYVWTQSLQNCLLKISPEADHNPVSFSLTNVINLLSGTLGGLIIAFIVTVFERIIARRSLKIIPSTKPSEKEVEKPPSSRWATTLRNARLMRQRRLLSIANHMQRHINSSI